MPMTQGVIPDAGGVWVLVEETTGACPVDVATGGADGEGSNAPLFVFLTVLGAAALHLVGA